MVLLLSAVAVAYLGWYCGLGFLLMGLAALYRHEVGYFARGFFSGR